jgi:hypothetical protein
VGLVVGFTLLIEGSAQKDRQQRLILTGIAVALVAAALVRSLTTS